MEIDFKNFTILDIEGNPVTVDISAPLGNAIYFGARDIAQADLGRAIYKDGTVTLTGRQARDIEPFVSTLSWPVRAAYAEILKNEEQ